MKITKLKLLLLISIAPFLLGSEACRKDYNFAAQSTVTGDELTVSFAKNVSTSDDESGTVDITVNLSAESEDEVTVPYTVTGTATEDTDFTITASPLKIAAGETTATITVTLTSDSVDDGGETVIVTLGDPTNATKGTRAVHTLTIQPDDSGGSELPVISFAVEEDTVAEGDDLVLELEADTPLPEDISVLFRVRGTATVDTDYEIDASPLELLADDETGEINLSALADELDDEGETVIVTLRSSDSYEVGDIATITVTIGAASADQSANTDNIGQSVLDALIALEAKTNGSVARKSAASSSGNGAAKGSSDSAACNWIAGNECETNPEAFHADTDGDGFSDRIEKEFGSDLSNPEQYPTYLNSRLAARFIGVDDDLDGLSNELEAQLGSKVNIPDTDGDGVRDGTEYAAGSDLLIADRVLNDADSDGLINSYEQDLGINPAVSDSDLDNLNDALEVILGTNPLSPDSDLDGAWDWKEVQIGSDPTIAN